MRLHIPSLRPCHSARGWRPYSATAARSFVILPDDSVETFRKGAFEPAVPAVLPRGCFKALPAIRDWFEHDQNNSKAWRLQTSYLSPYADATVPLELTQHRKTTSQTETTFEQLEAPLGHFIEWCEQQMRNDAVNDTKDPMSTSLYLAQVALSDLSKKLEEDLPTPDIVRFAGRGDVYNANIWMGMSTVTPLHKDPNPNLFVQLAGRKAVRLYEPSLGLEMFRAAQARARGSGSAAFRGPEMMQGDEKQALEDLVWGKDADCQHEVHVESGDGLFIPKGWWHSIKGVGKGITASVNWWFR